MQKIIVLGIVLGTIILSACQDSATESDTKPFVWSTAAPEDHDIDAQQLDLAFYFAQQKGFIHSFLLVRHGFLVGEHYFHGFDKSDAFRVMSVSKSFISALVGLAIENGYLESLDQKMMDFFPQYIRYVDNPTKYDITIRHLLSMRAGYDNSIEDYEQNWSNWVNSPDWLLYALTWKMTSMPGRDFAYITAETHLLSAILTAATDMSTLAFARRYLFNPLGITVQHWEQDPGGIYIGGFGMYFTARDLARFGYLYLRNGMLENKQILSPAWIDASLQQHSWLGGPWGELENIAYGYLWWLGTLDGKTCYMALGYGGQFIINFPELDLIIVVTSASDLPKDEADQQEREVLSVVTDYVLPAIM